MVGSRNSSASSDSEEPLTAAQLGAVRAAVQMADMYVRTAVVRQGLVLRSYLQTVTRMRTTLIALIFLSAMTAVICVIGALKSDFSHCCVPSGCSNVAGLNNTLPSFTLPGRVCLLTEAQAAAMHCPNPATTSALLNNGTCLHLSADCPSPYFGVSLIIGIACVGVTVACAALILPTLRASILCIILSWVLVAGAGLLALVLVAVGGGVLNSMTEGLSDDGIQTDSNDQPVQFTSQRCFGQADARGVNDLRISTELAKGQYVAFACVGFAVCSIALLPCMWMGQYRRLRAHMHRLAVLHILGDDDD